MTGVQTCALPIYITLHKTTEEEFDRFITRAIKSIKTFNEGGEGGHDFCYICGISPLKLKQFISKNFIDKRIIEKEIERLERMKKGVAIGSQVVIGHEIRALKHTLLKDVNKLKR